MSSLLTGINVQHPISQDILSGKKTIETRTYPIPNKYLNKEMAMIETPGKTGRFKARVVAIIKFTSCTKYKNKTAFYKDSHRHLVDNKSPWAWKDKEKYGWTVEVVKTFSKPIDLSNKRKGIVYTKNIKVDF